MHPTVMLTRKPSSTASVVDEGRENREDKRVRDRKNTGRTGPKRGHNKTAGTDLALSYIMPKNDVEPSMAQSLRHLLGSHPVKVCGLKASFTWRKWPLCVVFIELLSKSAAVRMDIHGRGEPRKRLLIA